MPTDEELVARLARGDEEGLRQLLARYERPLSNFLYRYTGGRDVEDLYQETWLRVVRGAERFDLARRFSTWMFQIAINLCRDWHRRPPPEVAPQRDAGTVAAQRRSDAALDAERLLATLDAGQRAVVLLRFFHDLTEQEVAETLDIPLGTVKSRAHNALRKMAAAVRDDV